MADDGNYSTPSFTLFLFLFLGYTQRYAHIYSREPRFLTGKTMSTSAGTSAVIKEPTKDDKPPK
jgi:hypothetical protein